MKQRAQPAPSVLWVEPDDEPVVLRPPHRRGRIALLVTLLVLALGAAALDWLERESEASVPATGRDAAALAASPARVAPARGPAAPLDTIGIERRVFPPPPPAARPAPQV